MSSKSTNGICFATPVIFFKERVVDATIKINTIVGPAAESNVIEDNDLSRIIFCLIN